MKMSGIVLGATMLSVVGCNGIESSSSKSTKSVALSAVEAGEMMVKFSSLSGSMANGYATFMMKDSSLRAELELAGVEKDMRHIQRIYSGTSCPTMSNDTSADGKLSFEEASSVLGTVILNLDEDLSSSAEEKDMYPMALENGSYSYDETGTISESSLEGKIVVIHGDASSETTVIACGIIGPTDSSQTPTQTQTQIQVQQQQQVQQIQHTQDQTVTQGQMDDQTQDQGQDQGQDNDEETPSTTVEGEIIITP